MCRRFGRLLYSTIARVTHLKSAFHLPSVSSLANSVWNPDTKVHKDMHAELKPCNKVHDSYTPPTTALYSLCQGKCTHSETPKCTRGSTSCCQHMQ